MGREVTGVSKDRFYVQSGQKRLKKEYKDPDMLSKVNKADMAGAMHHGVIRAHGARRSMLAAMSNTMS